ncbi:MAG: hypothetical protein LBP20_05845 [Treponema sp.]|nr:hypothetical protein [Treponema sp.]
MKKKPFKVLEERRDYNYIKIELFKKREIFSIGLSTSIGEGGIGYPEQGAYRSYYEAKNAALHCIIKCHKSPRQKGILKKFRLMRDLDQPLLFDDIELSPKLG